MQGDATRQRFKPLVYVPFEQNPAERAKNIDGESFSGAWFLLRTGAPPDQVAQAVRSAVRKLDPDAILEDFTTLKAGFAFVAVGLLLGLITSLGVNRVLRSQLVGVSPYDPVTLASAPVALILVALLACQIPTRRAMNVDPAPALRHD